MRLFAAGVLLVISWAYTADTRLDPRDGDPLQYLHAAQTFGTGEGFRNYDFHDARPQSVIGVPNAPMTTFPPLYSMALSLFGGDIHAARVLNALALWITIVLIWFVYGDYGIPYPVRMATLAAFLSVIGEEQRIYASALSETLFYPLGLAYLYALARLKSTRWLSITALIAVCLPMTRYVGIALVIGAIPCIVSQRGWKVMVAATFPACAVLSLWFIRNLALTGALTGNTMPGDYGDPRTVILIIKVIRQWFDPWFKALLVCGCLHAIWHLWQRPISSSISSAALKPSSTRPQHDS